MKKLLSMVLCLCLVSGLAGISLAENEDHPVVRISVANAGDIYAELYPEIAPITVENFLSLVDRGFYDGLTFHRIISGFMVQGGDPLGNGTGGSEQTIKGEFSANGVANDLAHTRGVISMARSSDMDSASSQFFIMHADAPHLDGSYAAFGKVLAGMGVVDRLCATTYVTDRNGSVLAGHAPTITAIARVDRAEAEKAMAAETANGKNGTFTEPTSMASFTVPEGWTLTQAKSGAAVFSPEGSAGTDAMIIFQTFDLYTYLAGINGTDAANLGLPREGLDTDGMGKTMLMQVIGITDESLLADDSVGGHHLYRITDSSDGVEVQTVIGAQNGVVYLLMADSGSLDTLNRMLETLMIP